MRTGGITVKINPGLPFRVNPRVSLVVTQHSEFEVRSQVGQIVVSCFEVLDSDKRTNSENQAVLVVRIKLRLFTE